MKKKAVLVAYVALLATPVAVMAQYPQLTEEAKAKYDKMITEARRRSDEAWAKALPIIEKEADKVARIYLGLRVPMICHRQRFRHFQVPKGVVCMFRRPWRKGDYGDEFE